MNNSNKHTDLKQIRQTFVAREGVDGITLCAWKSHYLLKTVNKIHHNSSDLHIRPKMAKGTFFSAWKVAAVTPAHKAGDTDYKPISLLRPFSKILER